jgi:hypothetical protein
MMMFTCESCDTQPERISNVELIGGVEQPLRVTLCSDCFEIGNTLPASDPRYVAMVNRIVDFKQAWPTKALCNRVAHAASLVKTEPEAALKVLQMRQGEPSSA